MIRNFRIVVFAILTVLGLMIPLANDGSAQTRLGLHVTQEELNIWKQRAQSGPYKTAGDVSTNSPGDWTHILGNADNLLATPTGDRWDGTGMTMSGSCYTSSAPGPGPGANRQLGDKTRDAAFAFLITGSSGYLTVTKNNLLYEAGRTQLNFASNPPWCLNTVWDTNPFFDMAHWLLKLVFAYDYIRPALLNGPNQDLSALSTLDLWFKNIGVYWESIVQHQIGGQYSPSRVDNLSTFTLSGSGSTDNTTANGRMYCAGPFDNNVANKKNNRMTSFVTLFAHIGVMLRQAGVYTTDATHLITMGKRFAIEYLIYSIMADGTPTELMRSIEDLPNQQAGWRYSMDSAASLGMFADALARTNDYSLFTYSTSAGSGPGGSSTAGGPKSLSLVFRELARYMNETYTGTPKPRYAKNDVTNCSSNGAATRIGADSTSVRDSFLAQTNIYYKSISGSNNVRDIYMRNAAGTPVYSSSPEGGGYYTWGGPSGIFPGVLFMFGQMEDKVSPYTTTGSLPTVNLGANPGTMAGGQSSTLTWSTSNTTSCSASGGWTGTKAISGTETVTPTQTTTYTLNCTGASGSASQSTTVAVSLPPPAAPTGLSIVSQ